MKTTTLFFAFLFSFIYAVAQDTKEKDDDFFFQTELDSLGVCYGKCLVQAEWDTVEEEVVIADKRLEFISKYSCEYDSIKLGYLFLYKNSGNLKYILDDVDTAKQIIMISKESRKLITCTVEEIKACYEIVTEYVEDRSSFEKWIAKKK